MAHFDIWFALQDAKGKYVSFSRNADAFLCYEPYYTLVELAVSAVATLNDHLEYIALIENGAISSIMDFALANHLYEDQSSLRQVILKPITRCDKCRIMYIDGVFYWDYVSEKKGRSAATPEQVLAKVCIPTAGYGTKINVPCLAKQLHESDLGLLQKTPAELNDFILSNSNAIEFDNNDAIESEEYYLKIAREILDGKA